MSGAARDLERAFTTRLPGAPDTQMALSLQHLGRRLLDEACGASLSNADHELIDWVRGGKINSRNLKDLGLYEPAKDENAFKRLKTAVAFLRSRLGYKGFLIAFDEGTRTSSFRRGSAKQKQAIENMLSMINDNADGQFGGVMFLYAATPDFRKDVITKYTALHDRIGTAALSPASPMVPLVDIDSLNTPQVIRQIGERLMDVYEAAKDVEWDRLAQRHNMEALISAQEQELAFFNIPPRVFVYQFCRFLAQQVDEQRTLSEDEIRDFVRDNDPTNEDEAA